MKQKMHHDYFLIHTKINNFAPHFAIKAIFRVIKINKIYNQLKDD